MFPKILVGLSHTQKAEKHKNRSDNCVIRTHFTSSLFFPVLCDYLFICLLIYFSLPRVQRACVWCALMAAFTKGEGRLQLHSGQREEKEHFKSLWLILWGYEKKRIFKKKLDQGYECRAYCKRFCAGMCEGANMTWELTSCCSAGDRLSMESTLEILLPYHVKRCHMSFIFAFSLTLTLNMCTYCTYILQLCNI